MSNLPECPPSLKQIQHYLKTASEHDARDPVVAYWCRLHALQVGLKLSSKKTPEETSLLMGLMDWLEEQKKVHTENEAITNEVAAQAYLENYALKLFLYADKQDREGSFGKNVVKAFYTSGMIYDVMATFGELTDEVMQNRKYAKWKAAYIHNCLKNGETPVSGPLPSNENDENDENLTNEAGFSGPSIPTQPTNQDNPNANMGFNAFPSQPNIPPSDSNPGGFQPYTPSSIPGGLPPQLNIPSGNTLPSVPNTPDMYPGGFHPYNPAPVPAGVPAQYNVNPQANVSLTPEQLTKAQKYCKWAGSALTYDDISTAISNLNNALQLLQTGHDPA